MMERVVWSVTMISGTTVTFCLPLAISFSLVICWTLPCPHTPWSSCLPTCIIAMVCTAYGI
ncbi:hypothetical protein RSAG8_12997, partial [Rhizoctonia solani AG-8 WAC10335]